MFNASGHALINYVHLDQSVVQPREIGVGEIFLDWMYTSRPSHAQRRVIPVSRPSGDFECLFFGRTRTFAPYHIDLSQTSFKRKRPIQCSYSGLDQRSGSNSTTIRGTYLGLTIDGQRAAYWGRVAAWRRPPRNFNIQALWYLLIIRF